MNFAIKPARKGVPAKGQRHKPGVMNKLEQSRAEDLEAMRLRGEINAWWFEAITFKLADDTRYTPDFVIQATDGTMYIEETKGFWKDDALVKIKVAAAMFPFRFYGLTGKTKKAGGGWERREFKGWADEVPQALPDEAEAAVALANRLF